MVVGRAVVLLTAGALVWAGTAGLAGQTASCPTIVWERVVGRNSDVPGIEGPWILDGNIAIAEGRIAFISYTESGQQNRGLYLGTPGRIDLIADRRTPLPNGEGYFRRVSLFPEGADGLLLAFAGGDTSGGGGLFLTSGSELEVVIDRTTIAPGGIQPLIGYSTPSLRGRTVGFTASELLTNVSGAYLWRDGKLIEIADGNTPVPGGVGTFFGFFQPRVSGSKASFLAYEYIPGLSHGIYLWENGNLRLVADGRTPAPGGTGNFRFFLGHDLLGSTVYFVNGDALAEPALYRWDDGVITRLADERTLDVLGNPIGPPEYVVATEQGMLLTTGFGLSVAGGRKLFLDLGQGLCPVLFDGDETDGVPALIDHQTRAGFDGRYLAVRLWFEPQGSGDRAIYRGIVIPPQQIPTLDVWRLALLVVLLGISALWMLGRR